MPIKELLFAMELIHEITERTKDLEFEVFLPIIAMLLEERCKLTGDDVKEMAKCLYDSVCAINAELGKY